MRGKNINMFLMDGTPTGRIKCTIANWTGVAYKLPRTELERCKNRDDLKQSGVYFLFGASNETGRPVAYIGQAGNRKNGEGILNRLLEHKRNADKDYWTDAVVFTTSNNSFGPTEISFLENKFCKLAINANRYEVKNGNDPSAGHITEEKESEMEEFVELSRIIMGTLGHNIFEPITESLVDTPAVESGELLFYLKRKNNSVDAVCRKTDKGYLVLKGSKISATLSEKYAPKFVRELRKTCKISSDNILLEDVFFTTPSAAQFFVSGSIGAPYLDWKTKDGVQLIDFEKEK